MRIGDLEFEVVSDGQVWADAGGLFGLVPRALYQRHHIPSPDNALRMNLNCLLVRSRGKTILIDSGLGTKLTEEDVRNWGLSRPSGGLLDNLAVAGVGPQDVDIVINTHLHWDHCGGNTYRDGEVLAPAFPRAEYWMQRTEWAEAIHPNARSRGTYLPDNFAPLVQQGRVRMLHGNTEVTDQVHCLITRGHTRAHQSVLLRAGEWQGLYVADMATYAIHMARAGWMTAYDVEPLENVRTKEAWQRWALDNQSWLFFEHDPEVTVARLVESDGRLEIEAVDPQAG